MLPVITSGGVKPKYKVITSEWGEYTEEEITAILETTRKEIDYCLQNVGKKFAEVDAHKMGEDSKSQYGSVGVITYGLIAYKHRNFSKSAEYFYRDWLELKKCEEANGKGDKKEGCGAFGYGPGDYNPLISAIEQWKYAGMYDRVLMHYEEYFDMAFLSHMRGETHQQKKYRLDEQLLHDEVLRKKHAAFMREWENTKKLAKTVKPKSLDPAVQNHEWFYSEKQEEVLKALEYYYQNKVRFMLEKALGHKDPAVAKKARELVDKLPASDK